MFSALTFVLLVGSLILVSVKSKPLDDDMLLFWRRSNARTCAPFTTYNEECNKCVCSAEGVPYCTKMLCGNMGEDKLQQKEYSDEDD